MKGREGATPSPSIPDERLPKGGIVNDGVRHRLSCGYGPLKKKAGASQPKVPQIVPEWAEGDLACTALAPSISMGGQARFVNRART